MGLVDAIFAVFCVRCGYSKSGAPQGVEGSTPLSSALPPPIFLGGQVGRWAGGQVGRWAYSFRREGVRFLGLLLSTPQLPLDRRGDLPATGHRLLKLVEVERLVTVAECFAWVGVDFDN